MRMSGRSAVERMIATNHQSSIRAGLSDDARYAIATRADPARLSTSEFGSNGLSRYKGGLLLLGSYSIRFGIVPSDLSAVSVRVGIRVMLCFFTSGAVHTPIMDLYRACSDRRQGCSHSWLCFCVLQPHEPCATASASNRVLPVEVNTRNVDPCGEMCGVGVGGRIRIVVVTLAVCVSAL